MKFGLELVGQPRKNERIQNEDERSIKKARLNDTEINLKNLMNSNRNKTLVELRLNEANGLSVRTLFLLVYA